MRVNLLADALLGPGDLLFQRGQNRQEGLLHGAGRTAVLAVGLHLLYLLECLQALDRIVILCSSAAGTTRANAPFGGCLAERLWPESRRNVSDLFRLPFVVGSRHPYVRIALAASIYR